MKRFLSILLSVMLLLGSLTVTVFADVPEFTLYTGGELGPIATYTSSLVGTYVVFNAVEGATYMNNGVAAESKESTIANTVALKVSNEGNNSFTAVVSGEASKPVSVFGFLPTAAISHGTGTGTRGMTAFDTSTLTDETLKAQLETGAPDTIYQATQTSASSITYFSPTFSNTREFNHFKQMVFVNGAPASTTYAELWRFGSIRVRITSDNHFNVYNLSNTVDTGFVVTPNVWHEFTCLIDTFSKGISFYVDGILVYKQASVWANSSQLYLYNGLKDANVYYGIHGRDGSNVYTAKPALTIADAGNGVAAVTATDVADGTTIGVFNAATSQLLGTALLSEGVANVALEGEGLTTVYAAAVDTTDNTTQLSGLSGKIASSELEIDIPVIDTGDELSKLSISLVTDDTHMTSVEGAMVGSKIRFNAASTIEGYTVKYFNNNAEVEPTVVADGIVALPVTAESNSYVAKVALGERVIEGYDSDPVEVTGLNLASYPSMSAGSVRSSSYLTNTTPAEVGITGINGDDTVSIGTRASGYGYWKAETVFTDNPNYDEYLLTIDAYVKTNNGVLNDKDGEAVDRVGIYGLKNNSGTSADVAQWLLIDKDGKVGFGGDSTISNETYTNYTASLDAWHTYSVLIHKATGKLDLYVDGVLVAKDFLSRRGSNLTGGPSVHAIAASTNVVYLKRAFTGTLYDTLENIPTEITADLATGEVVVPAVAVDEAYQAETIAVIGRKANDTVKVETFTFGEDASKTITLGAGYEQIFVWTWDDLVPLCDVIDE